MKIVFNFILCSVFLVFPGRSWAQDEGTVVGGEDSASRNRPIQDTSVQGSESSSAPEETTEEQPNDRASNDASDDVGDSITSGAEGATPSEPEDRGDNSEQADSYWDDDSVSYGASSDDGVAEDGIDEPTFSATAEIRDPLRMGGSVQHLGEEQLETLEYDDPHAILQQVPGVVVRTEDGFGLRPNIGIRGTNPERSRRITLMEDGVLLGPAPYSAPAAYYFPLMSRMVGVDVFKGPAALLFGPQTVAGAIDFRSAAPPTNGHEASFDLAFGRFNTRKIHFRGGIGGSVGGLLVEALHLGSTGFKEIDGNESDDTGFSRTDLIVRGFLQTNPTDNVYQRFDLTFGYGHERSNETYLGLSDADFADDPYRRYRASELDEMSWWRARLQLSHRLEVGDHFQIVTDAYNHEFDRTWDRLSGFEGEADLRSIVLSPTGRRAIFYDVLRGEADSEVDAGTRLARSANQRRYASRGIQTRVRGDFATGPLNHELEVGLRLHYDRIRRNHLRTFYRMASGELVRDTEPEPTTQNRGSALATSGYLRYALSFYGLTLTPGMRVESIRTRLEQGDTSQSETRTIVLPGVGATYAILDTLSIVAGVHRGFSPVAPGQSAEVDPETSLSYELGARFVDGARHLEVIAFLNDYSNLQGQCAFSTGCDEMMLDQQFNAGEAFVWGVEFSGSWAFDLGSEFSLPLRATYSYTGTRFQSDFESPDPTLGVVRQGYELPYVPTHQGQVQLGVEHPRGGAQFVANFSGQMREEAGEGEVPEDRVTDRIMTLDLVAWFQPFERVSFYVQGFNLTNASPISSRRPYGARTIRPLMVQAGVKLDL